MNKENIESIFPLSEAQTSFLMHHLSAKEDKGLVQLCFDIEGQFNQHDMRSALNSISLRYEVLRATVHWEKIKKPVIVIQKSAVPNIEFIPANEIEFFEKNLLRKKENERGISFNTPGISRLTIYQQNERRSFGIWSFHHILIDGWSATNLLNALFYEYNSIILKTGSRSAIVPSIKNIIDAIAIKKHIDAAAFWKAQLKNFQRENDLGSNGTKKLNRYESGFTEQEAEHLTSIAKRHKKSLATLLQLAWSLTLCNIYQQDEVVYGVVNSGRNLNITGIENAAFLLSNTTPFRFSLGTSSLEENLQKIENAKRVTIEREHDHISDIEKWIDWQGNSSLIETLFAYANFEWQNLHLNELVVRNLSGDYTSTHAISLILFEDTTLRTILDYDETLISVSDAAAILSNFKKTALSFGAGETTKSAIINRDLVIPLKKTSTDLINNESKVNYAYPTTPTQKLLNNIWQEVLRINAISIDDDFFELGGTSVQALRICVAIEKETKNYLNPTILLLNPTIRRLASAIDDTENNQSHEENTCLVPLKTTGNLPPLFCLHAGEGNILFYRDLAKNMAKENPLFAVQPKAIDEFGNLPKTIKGMAEQYYEEMVQIAKDQPLYLLGSCYSSPICLEIAEMAIADKKQIGGIFIADSPPVQYVPISADNKGIKRFALRVMWVFREKEFADALRRVVKRVKKKVGIKPKNGHINRKDQLAKNLVGYSYNKHHVTIEFLRSSQWQGPRYDHHINLWKEIVDKVNVSVVEDSYHATLFSPKSSPRLANIISNKIKHQQNET